MILRLLTVALALTLVVPASAEAAPTADRCAQLFVPEAYGLACAVETPPSDGAWRLVVTPSEGPFSRLSRLTVEPVAEPVARPREWLREHVRLDLAAFDEPLRAVLESPDNPISGEMLSSYLDTMLELVEAVASSPLVGCGEPRPMRNRDGWQMECGWGAGGIEKRLTMRLVEADGGRYLIKAEAMNPRRMRHLIAIANSFEPGPGAAAPEGDGG